MRWLYNLLFVPFFLASAPYWFWKMWRRGGWQKGFWQRFGFHNDSLLAALQGRRVLWLHAVSVGEVNLCVPLVCALRAKFSDWAFVVSTTTSTGMAELRAHLAAEAEAIYFPIDFPFCMARAVEDIRPTAVVLVEAEIWPNFFWHLSERGIPICLANARLSDRSYRGYLRFSFLFRPLFGMLQTVGAQDEADAERLRAVGCRPEAIVVTGNIKFDSAGATTTRAVDVAGLFRRMGAVAEAPILVGGSTHDGEERLLAEIFQRLKGRFPKLKLVLVPRHCERARAVGDQLRAMGVSLVYRSELNTDQPADCLLVDSTGELRQFFEAATVVFMGKSLAARGGQNPIEPAALGKAVVYGPHMENFRAVTQAFERADAVLPVRDAVGLELALGALLEDPIRRQEMGRRAQAVVRQNLGATDRTGQMLGRVLARAGATRNAHEALSERA